MGGDDVKKRINKLEGNVSNLHRSIKQINETLNSMQSKLNDVISRVNNVPHVSEEADKALTSLNETVMSIEKQMKDYETNHRLIQEQCHSLKYDLNTIRSQQAKLVERQVKQESHSKRDNLLFDGIPEAPTGTRETEDECLKKIYDILETKMSIPNAREIKIDRCHRVGQIPTGPRTGPTRPRSIIIKPSWYSDRQTIWKARFKLRNQNIFVNEDFPAEINQRRKKLFPIMQKAKKELNMTAYMVVDKLHSIDSNEKRTIVDVDTLHRLPVALDPRYITTANKDDCFAFFGELCPLSNFHPAPIAYNGKKFANVEQMYQYTKADRAADEIAAKKILESNHPAECKAIGDRVKESTTWAAEKEEVMKQALYLKFSQNEQLKNFLKQIKASLLAEASPNDLFWGTGVRLGREEATKVNLFRGSNMLGKLLCQVRNDIK